MRLSRDDIKCYRTNYDKNSWKKYASDQFVTMPLGVLGAIATLCDEVERLNKWKRR